MKTLFKLLAVPAVLAFSFSPSMVRPQDAPPPPPDAQGADQGDQSDQGASFQTFYDQLGDQGTWVQTDDYGYVFQPNVSDPDWAPYTDGHWVYTDEGWTWASDEPWGWATYHYGRWANIDGTGWVWVPGYRWAPAWVSWRYGGGYCGWAPLPPETFVGAEYGEPGVDVGIGFHFGGDVDVSFNIGPGCYNFVRVGDLGERNYRGHFLDRGRNYTVINNTTNITNINVNRRDSNRGERGNNFRGVAVGGPPINEVNAHSRQRVQTVQLAEANQPGRSNLQGNSMSVFAPTMNPGSVHQARPSRVSQTIAHPTFNRGDSINKPLDVTSRVKPKAPTAEAIQAAQAAQLHAPAKARIATDKTPVRTPLNKPLNSLAPVAQGHRAPNAAVPGEKTVNPNAEHPAANAPFTGEQVKPPVAQPNEVNPKPAQTFHPQQQGQPQNEAKPAQTFHPQQQGQPQNEAKPAQTFHPQQQGQPQNEAKPAQTFHPQQQDRPQNEAKPAQTFHPQQQDRPQKETKPPQAFQPQQQDRPQREAKPPQASRPQQQDRPQREAKPQQQPQGGGGGAPHTQAAPANHPAPSGGQGNKPAGGNEGKKGGDDKNKQQGQ